MKPQLNLKLLFYIFQRFQISISSKLLIYSSKCIWYFVKILNQTWRTWWLSFNMQFLNSRKIIIKQLGIWRPFQTFCINRCEFDISCIRRCNNRRLQFLRNKFNYKSMIDTDLCFITILNMTIIVRQNNSWMSFYNRSFCFSFFFSLE